MSDQPWWVKTIVWVGVPTAAMGFLLWFVVMNQGNKLDDIVSGHSEMSRAQVAMTERVAALVIELQKQREDTSAAERARAQSSWAQLSVQQRICLNTSKTDADRIACASLTQSPQ